MSTFEQAVDTGDSWLRAARRIEAEIGLNFAAAQRPDLERGLASAAAHFGVPDAQSCAELLATHRFTTEDRQALARCLAIGETYFFRDEPLFRNLQQTILPQLLQARRACGKRLRAWSAGCSTGEEPYSLAMLLAAVIPDWREWDISILATDLNADALRKARAGNYNQWSVRASLPQHALGFLIDRAGGRHEVHPDIRRLVNFAHLNLVEDCFPSLSNATSAVDLVLCRNVLIYFEQRRATDVLVRLGRSLAPDGWLLASSVEIPIGGVPQLQRVGLPDMTALRPIQPTPLANAAVPAAQAPARRVRSRSLPQLKVVARPVVATSTPLPTRLVPAAELAGMARSSADGGELERAAQLCRQAMDADKSDADLPYLLATILSEQGAPDEAGAALKRTLYLCPDHVLAHLALGHMAVRSGNAVGGGRHFSAALAQLSSRDPQAVLEGSGGMSCGDLQAIVNASLREVQP